MSRHGKYIRRLARHAKLADGQTPADVFAGLPSDSQLDVVDRRRSVQNDLTNYPALHPIDQVWRTACLDDVPAKRGHDRAVLAVGPAQVIAHPAKVVGG